MKDILFVVISQVMNVPIEEVNEDSSPNTIGEWDSLMHMNLILALEEEFKVQFSDEDIVNMTSVKFILETLKKYEK